MAACYQLVYTARSQDTGSMQRLSTFVVILLGQWIGTWTTFCVEAKKVLIFGCFRCLAGERNVLGQRFFYQIVSRGQTRYPRSAILSSDSGDQNVLGQRFFQQIVSSRRTECRTTTIVLSDCV
ncbi:uncharacterized protein [Atheta coriaria]|uniref:uncharacterized protein isoform X2 n=1 Tax=Dalotia coriaria TaxID=877792 RepID=UPI0031F3FC1E